jgi:hypothetical protein
MEMIACGCCHIESSLHLVVINSAYGTSMSSQYNIECPKCNNKYYFCTACTTTVNEIVQQNNSLHVIIHVL